MLHHSKVEIILCSVLMCVGCSTPQYWVKPNASQGELEQVRYQCLQQSQRPYASRNSSQYASTAVATIETNPELFRSCMESNGWRLSEQRLPPNTAGSRTEGPRVAKSNKKCEGDNPLKWDECVGSYTFPNGNQYTGEFRKGLRDGKGVIRIVAIGSSTDRIIASPVPSTYVGEFKQGRIHGSGIWTFDDGRKIEGTFANNQPVATN